MSAFLRDILSVLKFMFMNPIKRNTLLEQSIFWSGECHRLYEECQTAFRAGDKAAFWKAKQQHDLAYSRFKKNQALFP